MTELLKVQGQTLNIRTRGALTAAVVVDPADLATVNLPTTLGPDFDLRLHASPLHAVQPDADFMRGVGALVVQVAPSDPASVSQLEHIVRTRFTHLPVIAAVRGLTLTDTRWLMRLGIVDVVPLPFAEDDLAVALQHARLASRSAAAHGKRGRTIAFCKSVGGVGTTALATQAGCLLAAQYASQGLDVCLIDMDIQFGSAALQLDLAPTLTLGDLLAAGARLDNALLRSVAVRHSSGLNVIAAPIEVLPLEHVDVDLMTEILAIATQEFDLVLLDLPGAWTSWSLSMLAQADAVCLVTEMAVPSIRQARRQLSMLETHGLGQLPMHIVVNRYERSWFKTIGLDDTEQVLRRKVDFCIANDFRTVSGAIDQGKLVGEIKANSRMLRDLTDMMKTITARMPQAAAH